MEHFYKKIPGWSGSIIMVYESVIDRLGVGSHLVEIGSFLGRSSAFLVVESINKNKDFHIDILDLYEGIHSMGINGEDAKDVFLNNMKPVENYFNFMRKDSIEASKEYEDQSMDFVFLDGNRTYEYILEEIGAWLPKVKPGGFIGGDDFGAKWSGVSDAVHYYWIDSELEFFTADLVWRDSHTPQVAWLKCV
jgi:hypothetical protein